MRRVIVLVFFCLFAQLEAQPPDKFFTKFGGEGDDIGYSVKQTLDGQYIIAGSTTSYPSLGLSDIYVVKLDSMGLPLWEKTYGGSGQDVAKAVIELHDSTLILVGYTNSTGFGGYDVSISALDSRGNVLWSKTWGGADWEFGNDLVQIENRIYIVGYTYSFGEGKRDAFLLKCDLAGNILQSKYFGGSEDDELRSVIKTVRGEIATVGSTYSNGSSEDILFIKCDTSTTPLLYKTYGGVGADHGNDLVQLNIDSSFFICGASTNSETIKTQGYVLRVNEQGNFLRELYDTKNKTLDQSFVSAARSKHLQHLNAFVRNSPFDSYGDQCEIYVLKDDLYGYAINDNGGFEDEAVFQVESTRDKGYICVGWTKSFDAAARDVYFMKYDSTVTVYSSIIGVEELSSVEPFIVSELNDAFLVQGTDMITRLEIITFDGRIVYCSENVMPPIRIANPGRNMVVFRIQSNKEIYLKKAIFSVR